MQCDGLCLSGPKASAEALDFRRPESLNVAALAPVATGDGLGVNLFG